MPAVDVEYRILGPLEAVNGEGVVQLGASTQRALLAALLLHANEPVSTDRLVDSVWGETPPATATHAVSVYVSKLRKQLGADAIGRTSSGYVLRVAPGRLDLERFEVLVSAGREELAAGDATRACELLDDALGLWRGPALADLDLEDVARPLVARLNELRLAAIEARAEAMLAVGRPAEVISELEALTTEHPHDEHLCGLLMLALYRAGRQSDALACYKAARIRLSAELGIEPSESLRELERKVLRQDSSLLLAPETTEVRSVVVIPQRLDQLEGLAALTEPFGLSSNPHEVILAWLEPPAQADTVSQALAGASELLARLRAALLDRGARVRVAAFTAADRAADTLRLAGRPGVDLLVLCRDAAELDGGCFDPEVAQILKGAPCDVALWFARPGRTSVAAGPIAVPFGALEHDWAALELAAWISSTTQRPLVLIGAAEDSTSERRDASRLLADAGLLIQRTAGVVALPRLAEPGCDGLLEAVSDAGVIVAGLSERWSIDGLGDTRKELALSAEAPVLFLRRGQRPGGIAPQESLTLHRWSVTASAG